MVVDTEKAIAWMGLKRVVSAIPWTAVMVLIAMTAQALFVVL